MAEDISSKAVNESALFLGEVVEGLPVVGGLVPLDPDPDKERSAQTTFTVWPLMVVHLFPSTLKLESTKVPACRLDEEVHWAQSLSSQTVIII